MKNLLSPVRSGHSASGIFLGLILSISFLAFQPAPSLAEDPAPVYLPIAKVMREYQKKYYYLNHSMIHWIPNPCDIAAPHFPSDDYYRESLKDPEFAAMLVQDLVNKFWNTHKIFDQFVVDHHSDIEGEYYQSSFSDSWEYEPIPHYSDDTEDTEHEMPPIDPLSIGPGTSTGQLLSIVEQIDEYLSRLEWVEVQITVPEEHMQWRFTYGGYESETYGPYCDLAKQDSLVHWEEGSWQSGWDEDDEIYFNGIGKREWTYYDLAANHNWYIEYVCGRGKLYGDLTLYPGIAKVYIRMYCPEYCEVAASPIHSLPVDDAFHLLDTFDGGVEWWADNGAYLGDDSPAYVTDCPGDGGDAYWSLDDQAAIVEADFDQALINGGILEDGEDIRVDEGDPVEGGESCANCAEGKTNVSLNKVFVHINLGTGTAGKPAGYLYVPQSLPSPKLATPARLKLINGEDIPVEGIIRNPTTKYLTQVKGSRVAAVVTVDNDYQYHIDISHVDAGGLITDLIKTVTVENPDASPTLYNRLKITEAVGGENPKISTFSWNGTDAWQLVKGSEEETQKTTLTESWDTEHINRTETRIILNASDQEVSREVKVYRVYPWGEELVQESIGPAGSAQTTTWSFYCEGISPSDPAYGKVFQETRPDGSVKEHTYGGDDQVQWETITESATSSQTFITHDFSQDLNGGGNERIDTTLEKHNNLEISRQYRIFWSGGTDYQEIWDIQCRVPGAAWNAATNLVTKTLTIKNPGQKNNGKTYKVVSPTETVTLYSYSEDLLTTTAKTGKPNEGGTDIVEGTKTLTVTNGQGHPISTETFAIQGGVETSASCKHSDPEDFDQYGRVLYVRDQNDVILSSTDYNCCGVNSTTDREGVTTAYTYDEFNRVTEISRAGVTTVYTYDAAGRVLTESRNGTVQKTNTYDIAGRLTSSKDALNHETTYSETVVNNHTIKTTTFPNGKTRIEDYDPAGRLCSVTGSGVHAVYYSYGTEDDGSGIVRPYTKEIRGSADGTEWVKTYTDMAGRNIKQVYPDAAAAGWEYNGKGQLKKQTDPDGVITLFEYNDKGELTKSAVDMNRDGEINPTGTDRITQAINEVASAHDTTVRRTTTQVIKEDNSYKTISIAETSTDGLKAWSTVNGLTTTSEITYEPANHARTVKVTTPEGAFTESRYENGRLMWVRKKDSAGTQIARTDYTYDTAGRVYTVTDIRGAVTTYTYNDADQVTQVQVAGAGTTQTTYYEYDALGRKTLETLPHGTFDDGVVHYEYTDTGELQKTWGARMYPVEYTYDYAGRKKTMKTWKEYPSGGEVTTVWNYHAQRGWLTDKKYDTNVNGPSYEYYASGRLKKRTWARGVKTEYTYNNAGDLSGTAYKLSDDTTDPDTPSLSFTYDRMGRKSEITDGAGTRTLTYDEDTGQLESDEVDSGFMAGFSLHNTYDDFGRRDSLTAFHDLEMIQDVDYTYDNASRLHEVKAFDQTHTATYAYHDNSSLVHTVTFNNGTQNVMTTTRNFDTLNRLTSIASTKYDSTVFTSHAYEFTDANQRTKQTLADNSYWSYTYDNLGQVAEGKRHQTIPGKFFTGQQFEYEYDTIGNLTDTEWGGNEDGQQLQTGSWTSNTLNQYTATPSVTGYQFDDDGNLTGDGTYTYVYDTENRLIAIQSGTTTVYEAKYDYMGRMFYDKSVTMWTTENWLVYDGWLVAARRTHFSTMPAGTYLTTAFTWGQDLSGSMQGAGGIGGLLFQKIQYPGVSYVYYHAYDGNGNVTGNLRSDGVTGTKNTFTPYGQLFTDGGAVMTFGFSTKYICGPLNSLYYFGYRHYSPALGRWLNRDPMEEEGGSNLYRYVRNNPVNFLDPYGLYSYWDDITGTLSNFGDAYWETAESGEQISSVSGFTATFIQSINPFGHTIDLGPLYGQTEAYETGQQVGQTAGTAENTILLVVGTGEFALGAGALIEGAGSTPIFALAGGGSLVLEGSVAIGLGQGATLAGMGIWNMTKPSKPPGNKPPTPPSGQQHHAISKKIFDALERHPKLKCKYKYRDSRFMTQAQRLVDHQGYEKWHIEYDNRIVKWIDKFQDATSELFEKYLIEVYDEIELRLRFPNGLQKGNK